MTEEERKTIEEVKYFITDGIDEARPFPIDEWCDTLINLIQKQQKEIEQLKKHNKDLLRKLRNRVKEVKKLQNRILKGK